jgi:site-specific recombinase XerD
MNVKDAIVEYEIAVLRLSPHTQRWYSSKLAVFSTYCEEQHLELEAIKIAHIRLFLEWLKMRKNRHTGQPISTYTIHGYAAVVKRFLAWCSKEEDFDKLVTERLPGKIEMPAIDEKLIEVYTDAQVKAMIDALPNVYKKIDAIHRHTDTTALEVRDRAIVCILADTGIRVSELCSLTVENCFLSKDDAFLKIYGSKGHK